MIRCSREFEKLFELLDKLRIVTLVLMNLIHMLHHIHLHRQIIQLSVMSHYLSKVSVRVTLHQFFQKLKNARVLKGK